MDIESPLATLFRGAAIATWTYCSYTLAAVSLAVAPHVTDAYSVLSRI